MGASGVGSPTKGVAPDPSTQDACAARIETLALRPTIVRNAVIDLRSDTCSKPTDAMRRAMASAEVGDDVYGDDPTVLALEQRVAGVLGKEDAVFVATGTLSNQIGLRVHTQPGDQVLIEASAHVLLSESGAPAMLSGLTLRQIPGVRGTFTADQVARLVPVRHAFNPETLVAPIRLVSIENTHNVAGGTVWPIERIELVTSTARELGLATHLDGARLWNACARTGLSPSDYADHFDTVNVCLSKGLGAPIGSALAGSREVIARARHIKQALGGGWRQAGVIAAAALHALEHHRDRLQHDHANAARFARALAEMRAVEIDLDAVETNIVRFRLVSMEPGTFVERCYAQGLHMLPSGHGVRAVFHIGVSDDDTDQALEIVRSLLSA
jgi:threonine aldolase